MKYLRLLLLLLIAPAFADVTGPVAPPGGNAVTVNGAATLTNKNLSDPTNVVTATGSTAALGLSTRFAQTVDFINYGAKCDFTQATDGAISSSSAVLTSASTNFLSTDVGKHVGVQGAGLNYQLSTVASIVAAGTGYVPGDTINLSGGTSSVTGVVAVQNTKVVSATVAAGGSGGTPGTQTVTGTTGTGTRFTASVTVSAGGAVTAVLSIATGGYYSKNPTTLTAEPVTGAGLSGAQLNVVMGVNNLSISTMGTYTVIPVGTISQASTSGSGTGATFTATWINELDTTIASVSGNTATLNANASNTVSGATWFYATDDSTSINAALTAAKALPGPIDGQSVQIKGCKGNSYVASTLNFTGFESGGGFTSGSGIVFNANGMEIIGQTNGYPIIDALGSRWMVIRDIKIYGLPTNPANIGLQIGRYFSNSADLWELDNVFIDGYFAPSSQPNATTVGSDFYNFASETDTVIHPFFTNHWPVGSAYAMVLDGCNHWAAASQFVTQVLATDTCTTFNENVFVSGWFAQFGNALGSAPIWVTAASKHRFVGSYAAGGQYGVILYNEGGLTTNGMDFDLHLETQSMTDAFLVTGTTVSPTFNGFFYKDQFSEPSNSVFKLGGSATSATLQNADIRVSAFFYGNTVKTFDAPSVWGVTGDIRLPNTANWTTTGGGFSGSICYGNTCDAYKNPGGSSTNTASGNGSAGGVAPSGTNNTFDGSNAGASWTSGNSNTCVGSGACFSESTSGFITAVGNGAFSSANATDDVGLGLNACSNVTSGGSDICIGDSTTAPAVGSSHLINIGNFLYWNTVSTAAPAISACGTGSPAVDTHGNNRSGTITMGAGTLSSCTMTFAGGGYTTWDHCRVTPHATLAAFAYSYTLTTMTITATSETSAVVDYDCDGY